MSAEMFPLFAYRMMKRKRAIMPVETKANKDPL